MTLRKHLREAERKGLGKESARFGRRVAQYNIFRQACSCFRRFPARHTPKLAVQCDLTGFRLLNGAQKQIYVRETPS